MSTFHEVDGLVIDTIRAEKGRESYTFNDMTMEFRSCASEPSRVINRLHNPLRKARKKNIVVSTTVLLPQKECPLIMEITIPLVAHMTPLYASESYLCPQLR